MQTRSPWADFLASKLAPGEGDPFPSPTAPPVDEDNPEHHQPQPEEPTRHA